MPRITRETLWPIGVGQVMRGEWISKWERPIILAVSCPRCKSNKTWPCSTETGKHSSTIHAARRKKYHAQEK